ncbi:MAG: ATP-dependent DNA helicase [Candidatus Poribacteria bacterium]|nr:ATP-dependent DNA helicase [Candidatus Poribacteria bacterium]
MGNFKKDVFGRGGMLHRAFGNAYEIRDAQVNMSVDAAKAVLNRDVLLAEGATGVGKSFAYLITSVSPAIRQALTEQEWDAPIVISTSTKILQDQIWEKDVPAILEATGQDLKVVLAKGRNNYISTRRLHEFAKDVENLTIQFATADSAALASRIAPKLVEWITPDAGEFADFSQPIPHEIRLEIESTDTDCHGEACRFYAQCPYQNAKAKRKTADIIIVNHALLALHIAYQTVLPSECNTFIIDEAHKFYDVVSSVYETEITLRQLEWFFKNFRTRLRKLRDLVMNDTGKLSHLIRLLNTFEKRRAKDEDTAKIFFQNAFAAVQTATGKTATSKASSRFGAAVLTPKLDATEVSSVLSEYVAACKSLSKALGIKYADLADTPEIIPIYLALESLTQASKDIATRVEAVVSEDDPHLWCYWSEIAIASGNDKEIPYRLTLKRTPIDITEQIAPLFDAENAVIFTSATLQAAGSFARLRNQLGLDATGKAIVERIYPSPFPFQENVEIHLFDDVLLDRPSLSAGPDAKERYWQEQSRLVEYYVRLRDGRALVLCASHQQLYEISERLEPVFQDMDITVLRQIGTDHLRQTFSTFKADEKSVLFGVASCWEGLDAPGSTLETVIIPQLPFVPPHPVLDARRALLPNPEKDWFREISLPDMLFQLKQGTGRLVRSMTDRGVIAILSPRPLTKAYGREIRKALPPGRLKKNPADALGFLDTKT